MLSSPALPIFRTLRTTMKAQPSMARKPTKPKKSDEANDATRTMKPATKPRTAHLMFRAAWR